MLGRSGASRSHSASDRSPATPHRTRFKIRQIGPSAVTTNVHRVGGVVVPRRGVRSSDSLPRWVGRASAGQRTLLPPLSSCRSPLLLVVVGVADGGGGHPRTVRHREGAVPLDGA